MINNTYILEGGINIILDDVSNDQKLEKETRNLLSEIKRIVTTAELASSKTEIKGARSVDMVAVGGLLISILPTAVPEFIKLLRDWCMRSENRTVEIEIRHSRKRSVKVKISGNVSPEKLNEIINSIAALPEGKNQNGS